jgi:hypothetical protein
MIHVLLKLVGKRRYQIGVISLDQIAAHYHKSMETEHDNTFHPPEEEKNEDDSQYKVPRHAAVCAAAGKKYQGKKDVTDDDKGCPDAQVVGAEFVAHRKGDGDDDDHNPYRYNGGKGNSLDDPGDHGPQTGKNAETKDKVKNSSLQGKGFRKKVPGNKRL